jgi:hypothetical protein
MKFWIIVFSLIAAPWAAQALELNPLADGVLEPLPIDLSEGDIPCDQIPQRLQNYRQMARQHDLQVAAFLQQVGESATSWDQTIETVAAAQCPALAEDSFLLLAQTASNLGSLGNMSAQNSAFLDGLLAPVAEALPACLPGAAVAEAVDCSHVGDVMIDYTGKLLLHESAANSFLGDVSQRLNALAEMIGAYDCAALSDGEGLAVFPDGANKVDTLTNTAYDNAEKLANEFDRLSVSLSSCQQ